MSVSRQYVMQYKIDNKWHTVVGTNALLQDLCMGKHHRQRQILQAGKMTPKEFSEEFPYGLDSRASLADGELNGIQVRWQGQPAPFTKRPPKKEANAA